MHIPRHPWIMPESPNMQALMSDIMNAKVPELLVSGPRNCGKSWIISQCELSLAEMYPGIQIINLRHEMAAMGGLLNQWDKYILEYGLDDPRNPFTFHNSTKKEPRTHIQFDNGSTILFAGMDKPNKALGTAVDFAYYNEIQLEYNKAHWTAILGAMGGRAGNWGGEKSLAIADMNPTHKKFWAYLRANPEDEDAIPEMKHYRVRHKDRPDFFVWPLQRWTNRGRSRVDYLDSRYTRGTFDHMRNVLGKFCNAEGAVYPMYNPKVHDVEINRDKFGVDCKWYYAADWGRINAVGVYVGEPNGQHFLFKEIYRKDESAEEIADRLTGLVNKYRLPKFSSGTTDHESNGRRAFINAGFPVLPVNKSKGLASRIEAVKSALKHEKIKFNTDSLEEPDPKLDEFQRLIDELPALHYKDEDRQTGGRGDNLPDPQCEDHACDHLQYHVAEHMESETDDISELLAPKITTRPILEF